MISTRQTKRDLKSSTVKSNGFGSAWRLVANPTGLDLLPDRLWNSAVRLAGQIKDEDLLLKSINHKYANSWSSDGGFLLYTALESKTDLSDQKRHLPQAQDFPSSTSNSPL